MAALPRTGADEAAVPLTRIFHTCKMTCNEISVKAANKYRKVGHRQRLPVWWYIPMYMGRIRVNTMHFLVGSTMLIHFPVWVHRVRCTEFTKIIWFADDVTAASTANCLRQWLDVLSF